MSGVQVEEDSTSVPAQWAVAHPGEERSFEGAVLPAGKVKKLPVQDNHCDCGLFVLAFFEFFLYGLPSMVSLGPGFNKKKTDYSSAWPF